jgi:hypothetical protein
MMSHSPEPWEVRTIGVGEVWIVRPDGQDGFNEVIAECENLGEAQDITNAERIVACVNACQGWTTEELTDRAFLKTGMASESGRPVAHLAQVVASPWKAKAQECKETVKNAPHGEIIPIPYGD